MTVVFSNSVLKINKIKTKLVCDFCCKTQCNPEMMLFHLTGS